MVSDYLHCYILPILKYELKSYRGEIENRTEANEKWRRRERKKERIRERERAKELRGCQMSLTLSLSLFPQSIIQCQSSIVDITGHSKQEKPHEFEFSLSFRFVLQSLSPFHLPTLAFYIFDFFIVRYMSSCTQEYQVYLQVYMYIYISL